MKLNKYEYFKNKLVKVIIYKNNLNHSHVILVKLSKKNTE